MTRSASYPADANSKTEDNPSKQYTIKESDKISIDRSIARYTFWLVVFTGILAFSTIGLGIATIGHDLLPHKEFVMTKQNYHQAQSPLSMQKSPIKLGVFLASADRRADP
jgi:hypothetical protein